MVFGIASVPSGGVAGSFPYTQTERKTRQQSAPATAARSRSTHPGRLAGAARIRISAADGAIFRDGFSPVARTTWRAIRYASLGHHRSGDRREFAPAQCSRSDTGGAARVVPSVQPGALCAAAYQ